MKKLNIIIFIICVVLIFLNFSLWYDLSTFEIRNYDWGVSMEEGILMIIIPWTINVAIAGILFLIVVIRSIRKKETPNIYTLLNVALLILLSTITPLILRILS